MTEVEEYIASEVAPHLRSGESVIAYATLQDQVGGGVISAARAKGYLAALTSQRIILIETRIAVFRVMQENRGVTFIERLNIAAVAVTGFIIIQFHDGTTRTFQHQSRIGKYASTEEVFRDTLHQHYGQGEAAQTLKSRQRLRAIGSIVLGLAVAGLYIGYREYWGKAEVEVRCQGAEGGVACELSHISSGADANACWEVHMTCQNSARPHTPEICAEVKPKESTTVNLASSAFFDLDKCDVPKELTVRDLTVR